jgi:hypothetical protein
VNEVAPNLETLLREALAPVEPPSTLHARLELALTGLTEFAAEELEGWELRAMRDPRNWVRPAAAVVVGSTAGAALIVLAARQRRSSRDTAAAAAAGHDALAAVRSAAHRALHDIGEESRRILHRR